ncbi:hypothetical protein OGAPHI_005394 [Ogataea philodendri]|uniref:Zn(2)-C6 fungal-type domain-containing protein n=1 Tax=Ogataea philodendri TaxID=1378263 RepID=A0A9P8P2C1_9ASCO|nr:uncharacterized protein OGAPHI_005394 [Ogataea philodendri]KAH3663404.1 hypothetical protein OGAPHI_005394 [Ogataea philodendri]
MDEIADASQLKRALEDGHIRGSTRCYRCKTKRLKCQYEFPQCSNCVAADEECFAWIKGLSNPIPRSLICHLEKRVAELEIELSRLSHHPTLEESEAQASNLAKFAAAPFLKAMEQSENGKVTNFSFLYFRSSSLPPPFDSIISNSERGNMHSFLKHHSPVDLLTIPRDVVRILMDNYISIHQPQYPIISILELKDIETKVFDSSDKATSFDIAVISIALAISAATLTHKSEKKSLSSSSVLFSRAMLEVTRILWANKLQKLQITLLIAHYGFANPYAADVWYSIRECLRLSLDLGLHVDLDSTTSTIRDIDYHRRLFMVAASMSRHLSAVIRISFPIPTSLITVGSPSTIDDSFIAVDRIDQSGPRTKAAALHFFQFRLYETEVHEVLWLGRDISLSLDDWFNQMETNLEKWYLKAEEFAKVNQLRFRLICKASLQTRLRRRTPRNSNPPRSSYVKLVNSLMLLIDEYLRDTRSGQVFYLLMGVYYVEEAAVNLADVMWNQAHWILEYFTYDLLASKLKGAVQLLERFAARWPDIHAGKMVETLSQLENNVSSRLRSLSEKGINSESVQDTRDEEITGQIDQLLFPQKDIPHVEENLIEYHPADDSFIQSEIGMMENLSYSNKQSKWNDNFNIGSLPNLEDYVQFDDWL